MNRLRKAAAVLAASLALASLGALSAAAEKVECDILGNLKGWGEATLSISHNEAENTHTVKRKNLEDGGYNIVYFSATYQKGWKLAYDFTFDGNFMAMVIRNTGKDDENTVPRFLNGENEFLLAERIAKQAGVKTIQEGDHPQLPGGTYKGVLDLSDVIPEGYKDFQHFGIWINGKQVVFRQFAFVSGAEATPDKTTAASTKATTAGKTEETAAVTDSAGKTGGGGQDTRGTSIQPPIEGFPVWAVVTIAVAGMLILAGAAIVIVRITRGGRPPREPQDKT